MNAPAEKLFEEALRLPDTARAELAACLIQSLDTKTDEDVEAAWDVEIGRRIAELDAGLVEPIPWSEARRMILDGADGSADA